MNYERIYEFRFRGVDLAAKFKVWKQIAAYLYEKMGEPERILDPAAGYCEFINQVPSKEKWAVDMSPAVEKNAAPEVKAVVADIFAADLPKNHFDAVFMSNFLEHLPSAERIYDFLSGLKDILREGGLVCIVGPNFKYCSREYYDCADHLVPLTHIAVEELLYSAGYEIVESHGKFLPFSFRGLLPPSPTLTRIYLRMPFLWHVLGKQFLIIARPQR